MTEWFDTQQTGVRALKKNKNKTPPFLFIESRNVSESNFETKKDSHLH